MTALLEEGLAHFAVPRLTGHGAAMLRWHADEAELEILPLGTPKGAEKSLARSFPEEVPQPK